MGLASCFSALEVVPLTLLTLDASGFIKLRRSAAAKDQTSLAARHKRAIYFFIAVGVWNFIGAGVFGFLINTPIVSYFEVGTTLTANHGHAAMFGVFGMLGLGVLVFCLRAMQGDEAWRRAETWIRIGYWGLNAGLALMILLDLFPAGADPRGRGHGLPGPGGLAHRGRGAPLRPDPRAGGRLMVGG